MAKKKAHHNDLTGISLNFNFAPHRCLRYKFWATASLMIRSHLSRVRIKSSRRQRLPSHGLRLLHDDNSIPSKIESPESHNNNLPQEQSNRKIEVLPKHHHSQFISSELAIRSPLITYEKLELILQEREMLERDDSAFRPMLLQFFELELMKVDILQLDDLNKLVSVISSLRKSYNKYPKIVKFLEKNLSNVSIVIFGFIYNPKYITLFMNNEISFILKDTKTDENEKLGQIYHLLNITNEIRKQFGEMQITHDERSTIHHKHAGNVMKILDRSRYAEFFIKLLEYECDSISSKSFGRLRYELSHGQPHEQEVFEFHAILQTHDEESLNFLRRKILTLYSFDMLKNIVVKYIQRAETEKVEFYMEYLLAKYALEKEKVSNAQQLLLTTKLYEVITYHSVRLKNYASATELLETIKDHGIKITPKMLHILTTSFRKKKMFDAVLLVLNKTTKLLKNEPDSIGYKNMIAVELLITLREKFPDNPKLVVSQFMSIFEGSEVMLNQLGLLSLLYDGTVSEIVDLKATLPTLYKTEVSDFFKITNGFPSMENMTELYISILNHVGIHKQKLPIDMILRDLFNKFKDYVIQVQSIDLPQHPFSKGNIDEGIVNVFVTRTINDLKDPPLATIFLKTFLQNCDFKRFDGHAASLILYFWKYAEHYEIDELMSIMKKLNAPLGFYAITAMILRNDSQRNYTEALEWYTKLLELGKPITHYGLIQVIKKNKWELPKNFDKSLLETEYMAPSERKEIEFAQHDDMFINDPDFIHDLSNALDKLGS